MVDQEVEQIFEEFWKPILIKNDRLDIEQLKKELFDYHAVLNEVSKVYEHITRGQVSNPNTAAEVVIAMFDDIVTEAVEDALQNDFESRKFLD